MSINKEIKFIGKNHSWRARLSSKYKKECITPTENILLGQLKPALKGISKIQQQKCIFTKKSFYLTDLYLKAFKIGIEIDGGYHTDLAQQMLDDERTKEFHRRGIFIIRFTNDEVLTDIKGVIQRILDLCNSYSSMAKVERPSSMVIN